MYNVHYTKYMKLYHYTMFINNKQFFFWVKIQIIINLDKPYSIYNMYIYDKLH